ncbi:hypothetical protein O181_077654 [Austropuccinia psidii MF-1]|uniref:Uncharacterized protein n=1 Tax=Austropuccinia psidii MF-1 TaxID=1389203 RepID=A0A9Q3IGJ3_9BASI|nr:hypothetical protein [Austropuccinia psidii MF-1]
MFLGLVKLPAQCIQSTSYILQTWMKTICMLRSQLRFLMARTIPTHLVQSSHVMPLQPQETITILLRHN